MRLNRVFIIFIFITSMFAKTVVNIDFKDLEITDFIKLTSKILNKNILLKAKVPGKVDFISTTTVYKKDLLNILLNILEDKGYTLVEDESFLHVVRSADIAKYNLPVYRGDDNYNKQQFVTHIFKVEGQNVDVMSSKIRHFLSKYAKVITVLENNSIIITDYPANIQSVKKVFDIITQDSKKDVETIKLNVANSTDIVKKLQSIANVIFNNKILEEKVTIVENKETNSILLMGIAKNIAKLKEIIFDLDKKDAKEEKVIRLVKLKNVDATTTSKMVLDTLTKKGYVKERLPSVSSSKDSNHVVVVGFEDDIEDVEQLLKELDKESYQVYLKAKILEISQGKSDTIGIKYGFEGGFVSSSGLLTFAGNLGGAVMASSAVSSALDVNNISKGLALGASLDLLIRNDAAQSISEPSILCIDKKECKIYAGRTQSIAVSETKKDSATDTNFKREDIGITLKIKPSIGSDDKVTLNVSVKTEDILSSTSSSSQPTTTKREINTFSTVSTGESIIIGGLIKDKRSVTENKIPFFGDLPIIGALFRHEKDVMDRSSLVVIVTPYIVKKSEDLSILKEDLTALEEAQNSYNIHISRKLRELELEKKSIYEFQGDVSFDDIDYDRLFMDSL